MNRKDELIAKLRYMGRQYSAGQYARGGGQQKHYLEEAADEIERLRMADNRATLFEEDIWCLHKCLDEAGVPRDDGHGNVFSMWGRVLRFKDMPLNVRAEAPTPAQKGQR